MGGFFQSIVDILMSPVRLARYLLLSPLILILFGWICSLISPLGDLVNNFFLTVLGEFGPFQIAAGLISGAMDMKNLTVDAYFANFGAMLSKSIYDSVIPGCCVLVLKSVNSYARKSNGIVSVVSTVPEWILTVAGIAIGLVIVKLTGLTGAAIKLIVYVMVFWAIIICGIRVMGRHKGGSQKGIALRGAFVALLMKFAASVLTAQCCFFMLSVIMTSYSWTRNGYQMLWFLWSMLSVGVVLVVEGVVMAINSLAEKFE